jgi:hypothetical protein
MIKSIVSVTFATMLIGSAAYAQTSSTSTTVATGTNGVSQTTTTTTESTGTVTEFTPGHVLFLKTEAAEPVQYKFGKTVTYMKLRRSERIRRFAFIMSNKATTCSSIKLS